MAIFSSIRNLIFSGLLAMNVYFWVDSGNPVNAAAAVFIGFYGFTLAIQDAARERAS